MRTRNVYHHPARRLHDQYSRVFRIPGKPEKASPSGNSSGMPWTVVILFLSDSKGISQTLGKISSRSSLTRPALAAATVGRESRALDVGKATVERVRRAFVEDSLGTALDRPPGKPRFSRRAGPAKHP